MVVSKGSRTKARVSQLAAGAAERVRSMVTVLRCWWWSEMVLLLARRSRVRKCA